MPTEKVFFFEREKMLAGFQRIIKEDPLMGKMKEFHAYLVRFAGKATYAEHACMILAMAHRLANGYPVDLGKHLEAMVDDAKTVEEAKKILENAAIISMAKRG